MGSMVKTRCRAWGKEFEFNCGGGFFFHLLRCDRCGLTKSIGFDKIPDLHARYLKGLPGPYAVISAEHDKAIRHNPDIKPISEKKYYAEVEKVAGKCKCGGAFLFDAPPRCPKCNSTDIEEGKDTGSYD